ncbi:multiple epidermal growth factor-like domains protein 10 [Patella vulgata]|uniref:multiple epidermal growth factor-like domains protein 10 n=1 Tax=Patella vulgata TaxID=6465 RepID=UPI0024A80C74|nr:multiple epidermal growth factor-like domains protein 10 [Patella vulgata]
MYWGGLQGFEIKTSSSGQCSGQGLQSATSCYKDTTSTIQSVYNVTGCNQGSSTSFSGRTVYVSTSDALTLCEVEIFADLAQCNTGYYNTSRSTCQACNTCRDDMCDPTTGVCTVDCKTGFYGATCQQSCNTCRDNSCDSTSGVCTGDCKTDFYGTRCQQNCSNGCLNNQCSKSDGRCNNCKPDTVGPYCNLTCGTECQPRSDQNTTTCDRNGRCANCRIGRYSDGCGMNCNTGCGGGCDRGSGRCINCITGRYGEGCDRNCSTGCDGGCDRNDGKCTSCIQGKTGDRCDTNCNTDCTVCNQYDVNSCTECKDGKWGSSCNKLCNTNCKPVVGTTVGKCNQMTGHCINGCVPGKIGSKCTTACEAGRYGENCTSKCGNCADETTCDVITGSCGIAGCADGFQGSACQDRLSCCTCSALSPVVYVVIGLLCGILGSVAVFLSYHFYKKRRQSNNPKDDTVPDYVYSNTDLNLTSSTTDDTLTTGYQNIPTNTRNVEYENQSFNTEDNTRTLYDTLDHTPDSTQHTYTILDCNKIK